jgi:hypothetical protein
MMMANMFPLIHSPPNKKGIFASLIEGYPMIPPSVRHLKSLNADSISSYVTNRSSSR